MASRQTTGRIGEAAAQDYLERQGYRIVDVNVRLPQAGIARGELDIVAWDRDTLCFIEVKTRNGAETAPAEAVHYAKQRQIARLALAYAAQNSLLDDSLEIPFRFDVVAVRLDRQRVCGIELIRGAFLAPEEIE